MYVCKRSFYREDSWCIYVCMCVLMFFIYIFVYFLPQKPRTNIITIRAVIPTYTSFSIRQISGQIRSVIMGTDLGNTESPGSLTVSCKVF